MRTGEPDAERVSESESESASESDSVSVSESESESESESVSESDSESVSVSVSARYERPDGRRCVHARDGAAAVWRPTRATEWRAGRGPPKPLTPKGTPALTLRGAPRGGRRA
jgi:hypothetical protein